MNTVNIQVQDQVLLFEEQICWSTAAIVARENAPLLPDTPEVNAETEVFSLEKFVFLWLGIGRKYCEWTRCSDIPPLCKTSNVYSVTCLPLLYLVMLTM